MADYNRNQDNQFDQSSGRDQNRRRFDQESDYNRNRENYGGFGNTGMSEEWNRSGQGGYSGASSGWGQQGRRDTDENRGWQGRGDQSRGMGSREGWQDRDWQRSGYERDERQGYGGEYRGASDYRQRSDEGGYGEMGDRGMRGGRNYGEVYGGNLEERERMTNQAQGGRQNIMANRPEGGRMYGGMREEDWRSSGQYGSDYGRSDYGRRDYGQMSGGGYSSWDRSSGMGGYGNRERRDWEGRDYSRMDRGDRDRDRSWWDKTRDEVSSWFGDDDAERRRLMDERRSESYRGKGPRDYKRSDDRIREDVCDRLSDDPFIDASDIEVRVDGTEVILSGRVDSREAKRRAEDMVENISGVSNVQNQLKVSRDTSSNTGTSRPDATRDL